MNGKFQLHLTGVQVSLACTLTVGITKSVSLILSYLTAYQMLYRSAKIKQGQTILIHACAGAVGIALLQLGKLLNLKIYGTASLGKHSFIEKYGAIPIDYKHEDFVERLKRTEPNGIAAVFDENDSRNQWQ